MFTIPPIIQRNITELLVDIELFINAPCDEMCKEQNNLNPSLCSSCQTITLHGVNVYPRANSLQIRRDKWIGLNIYLSYNLNEDREDAYKCINLYKGPTSFFLSFYETMPFQFLKSILTLLDFTF